MAERVETKFDSNIVSLQNILETFSAPIGEEQAWAVCFECARLGSEVWNHQPKNCLLVNSLSHIFLQKDGSVDRRTWDAQFSTMEHDNTAANRELALTERKLMYELGVVIYRALDYGVADEEERQLSDSLESLIDLMTSAADMSTDGGAQRLDTDDEGIEQDSESSSESSESSHGTIFSLNDVINLCSRHVQQLPACSAEQHYRAVCRALVAEYRELATFLSVVQQRHLAAAAASAASPLASGFISAGGGRDAGGGALNISSDMAPLSQLNLHQWVRLWMQIIGELRQGVKLKKVQYADTPLEFELTPYEMLMDDIRSRRYKLRKVMIDGDIPCRVKKDAHAVILDFIRSRPPLKKASERRLSLAPMRPRTVSVHEQLMLSIRCTNVQLRKITSSSASSSAAASSSSALSSWWASSYQPVTRRGRSLGELSLSTASVRRPCDFTYSGTCAPTPLRCSTGGGGGKRNQRSAAPPRGRLTSHSALMCDRGQQQQQQQQQEQEYSGSGSGRRLIRVDPALLLCDDDDDDNDDYDESVSPDTRHHHLPFSIQSQCTALDLAVQSAASLPHSSAVLSAASHSPSHTPLSQLYCAPSSAPCSAPCSRRPSLTPVEGCVSPPVPGSHETVAYGASQLQQQFLSSTAQCLSLTLDELVHIRSVLTRAELDSLPLERQLRHLVAAGRICFLCLRTRFSRLFGDRGTVCRLCRRVVCARCSGKMRIPLNHFATIPVYSLTPSALSPSEETPPSPGSMPPVSGSDGADGAADEQSHSLPYVSLNTIETQLKRVSLSLSRRLDSSPLSRGCNSPAPSDGHSCNDNNNSSSTQLVCVCRGCKAMLVHISESWQRRQRHLSAADVTTTTRAAAAVSSDTHQQQLPCSAVH